MITFYKADETDFDNNGLGVLDHDIQNPDIEEKLNDIFTFSFNYPIFGVNGARLAARMIVKADDPENEGQLFRIMKLSKSNGMLTAFCYHIFYDLNGNEIPDTNIVGQNGQTAIAQMLSKTAVGHKFQGYSDISDIANIRVVRMSPVKFLIDPQTDNNFINRLGGEIRRVNYRIWMNKVRGSDNGATIRWKKSLDSYNATWDYTTIATRIRPVGYNGIMLPESYVDSPLINKYETIVIKEIQYSDIKAIDPNATSNDETAVPLEQAYELLRQAAAKEFSGNNLDKPTVTLSVNMVALRNMDEYKDVKSLETINPWDTVTVINERDDLSVKVRLNHYHWNPVTRKFISMELGNAKSTFTDIGSKVDHATNLANQANDTANTAAESANGKNSNYYGPSEPYKPVDGDLWYKKNGDKTELWQYDGKSVPPGWKLVVDDATGEEVRQNVDAAQKEAEEAKTQANESVAAVNDAVAKAGFANDTATQAKSDAAAAGQQAKDALTNAGTALTNAKNALANSNSAQADSAQSRKDSATAKIQATNAATQANQAVTDATTAKADANTAKINATQAINDAATAKGQAANALGQANTAINNAANALDKFNNMQVGGRNLYLNSKAIDDSYAKNRIPTKVTVEPFDSTTNMWHIVAEQGTGSPNGIYLLGYANNKLPDNSDWSYSADVKGTGKVQTFGIENGSMNPIVGTVGTEWSRISQTGHVDNEHKTLVMYFDCNSSPLDVYIKLPKLETGNMPTDWSPAPEDVQQQFTDINGELANKVSQTTYNTLAGTVDTVNTLAKQNQSTISTLATKTSVDTVNHTATTAQTLAQQNANELLNKANSTTVNTLTQRVTTAESTLKQTATTAQLAMTQKDVDGLSDTVTTQGLDITAMADGLKLKADTTTVNQINGTVNDLKGELDVQADKIAATVSASDVTGMLNGYATQTWAQSQIKMTADGINGTMSSIKSTVDGQTTSINGLKADSSSFKGQFTTVNNTIGKHTTDIGTLQASSKELTSGFNTLTTDNTANKNDISQLKQTSTEVSSTLETVQTQVQDSAVGINLLRNTRTLDGWNIWYGSGEGQGLEFVDISLDGGQYRMAHITNNIDGKSSDAPFWPGVKLFLNAGQVYTISIWTHSLGTSDQPVSWGLWLNWDKDNSYQGVSITNTTAPNWTRYSATFTAGVGGQVNNVRIVPSFKDGAADNTGGSIYLLKPKLEKGSVATDFSVNPADNATVTALSKLSQTVNGIQTTVSGKADQSQVTQLAGQITSVVGDVSANSSQITQMKADINLRVKAGDVVNQINISPESILIAGQKVHITGQTSIDNAVIKDAMIADIKADKITAGTLNAANVNVINLNANNITTGTLKGANLSMNLNTGEVLFQKGSIKSSDGTFAVDIDNRTITSTDNSHNGIVLKHGELLFYKGINAGSGSAEFGRMDVAYFNGGGLNITGYNGLTLGTETTGLYEANLALVSPKNNSGKSIASLVGDVIYLQPSPGNLKGEINISGKTDIAGSVSVVGDFGVIGKKNAIHPTNDGIRETPAYETAESYLGDIGEGITDESGRTLIHIDALFNQIINTDYDYQVFVSSYSNAIVWVEERKKASFEIHSNISNAKFAWEIKAKRRGYETDRLVKSEMKYEQLNKFHEKKVTA